MGHLKIRRQWLQLTKEKTPYIELEDKFKTNVAYCTTMEPSTTK